MLDEKQLRDEIEYSAVIALGSNLHDPRAQINKAIGLLRSEYPACFCASSVYRTAPVKMRDASEDFANAVVTFKTTRSPQQLLTQLRIMERDAGRPWQHGPNEDRILDLDIIAYGDLMVNQENLSIPHPRAHQRQFVMVPLLEICPDFRFPGMDKSLPALVNQALALRLEKWC